MSRIVLTATAALVLLANSAIAQSVPPTQTPVPNEAVPRRVALLVGINQYQKPGFDELKWAENDVDELAVELHKLRFDQVVVMKGSGSGALRPGTAEAIKGQLLALLGPLGKDDLVLVALIGHGQQVTLKRGDQEVEEDFFCPAAAVDGDPTTMLSLTELTEDILRPRVGLKLLLIDACRQNTADARFRGRRTRGGIQGRLLNLPLNTSILFACLAGQKSLERDDLKHSVFSQSVIEALRAGSPTWTSVIRFVEDRVPELNPRQEVISTGSLKRVFLAGDPARRPAVYVPTTMRVPDLPLLNARSERKPLLRDSQPGMKPKSAALFPSVEPAVARPGDTVTYRITARLDPGSYLVNRAKFNETVSDELKFDLFDGADLKLSRGWSASRVATVKGVFEDKDGRLEVEGFDDGTSWAIELTVPNDALPGKRALRCQAAYRIDTESSCSLPGRWTLPEVEIAVIP